MDDDGWDHRRLCGRALLAPTAAIVLLDYKWAESAEPMLGGGLEYMLAVSVPVMCLCFFFVL